MTDPDIPDPTEDTPEGDTGDTAATSPAPAADVPASNTPESNAAEPSAAAADTDTGAAAPESATVQPADEAGAAVPPEENAAAAESAADATLPAAAEPAEAGHPEPLETSGERTLDNIVEALLLAADSPLRLETLQRLVGDDLNVTKADLRVALERLGERLAGSAAELHEVGGGWRIQVRREYAHWVSRLWQEKPPKLSRATLETLALIVYRQPATRGEIEDVRGVAVSPNILRTLLERGWIREVGYKEVPGRPALFGTTQQFLDDFNLRTLDQLPPLPELKDIAQLEAALARLAPPAPAAAEADAAADPDAQPPATDEAEGSGTEAASPDATLH